MPQPRQPFVHDLIAVLAAPTQVLSQRSGAIATSVDRPTVQGVIHADTRVLSGLSVTIDGEPGEHLATALDGNQAQFTFLLPTVGTGILASGDQSLRLDWFRVVEPGSMAETLMISSPLPAATDVDVMVVLSCDFAPLESIRRGQAGPPLPFPVPIDDHFGWVHEEMALSLVAHGADLLLSEDRCRLTLHWRAAVPAGSQASVRWRLSVQDAATVVVAPSSPPLKITNPGSITATSDHRLRPWLTRSLEDLSGLWMATRDAPEARVLRRRRAVVSHTVRTRQHLDSADAAASRS